MISYEVTLQELVISTYFISIFGNPSFLCLLGSRMFFNLKEAGEDKPLDQSEIVETMQFGQPPSVNSSAEYRTRYVGLNYMLARMHA